jgi:uncharacterized membrane protein
MKSLTKYFVNGIITIVPIGLVLYVVFQVFGFLDGLLGKYLKAQLEEQYIPYIPGIGLLFSIVLITATGWLATQYVSKSLLELVDRLLNRIPVVKSLYSILKETIQSFFGEKRSFSKVALIRIPGTSMRVMGFITSEEMGKLTDKLHNHTVIYIPQSFQMAGMTVIVPKEDVEIIDISTEEAMRFILSAGVSGNDGAQATASAT